MIREDGPSKTVQYIPSSSSSSSSSRDIEKQLQSSFSFSVSQSVSQALFCSYVGRWDSTHFITTKLEKCHSFSKYILAHCPTPCDEWHCHIHLLCVDVSCIETIQWYLSHSVNDKTRKKKNVSAHIRLRLLHTNFEYNLSVIALSLSLSMSVYFYFLYIFPVYYNYL